MLLLRRRLHRQRHRRDVGPGAAADLLEVVDQHVDVLQHLRRRAAILGHVERIDRHAGLRIGLVGDLLAGLRRRRGCRARARAAPPASDPCAARSGRWPALRARSIALWLVIRPTRLPRSAGGTSERKTSMPGRTSAPGATWVAEQGITSSSASRTVIIFGCGNDTLRLPPGAILGHASAEGTHKNRAGTVLNDGHLTPVVSGYIKPQG